MLSRSFGSTGQTVSGLGFGGMRFKNLDDVDACAALVHEARDLGITYFDTAIGYGKSEEVMGVAFKEMQKDRAAKPFTVASKTFAATADDVRRDCEISLKRLNVDALDFYHVWCVLSPDAWRERKAKGVIAAFEHLRDEGLVRHISVSTHMSGDEIAPLLEEYPFVSVLLGYSALNFAYREAGVAAAARLGRGVVVMNPLAGGVIPQHPQRFGWVKTRDEETVVEGALRFLWNDPRISVVLVGISDREQLHAAVRAAEGFRPIPAERIARMRSELSAAFDSLCTGCGYCSDCPESLPLPKLMDAVNQGILAGEDKAITDRLRWQWNLLQDNGLDRCTRCRQCEAACTQHLPIVDRLERIRGALAKVG